MQGFLCSVVCLLYVRLSGVYIVRFLYAVRTVSCSNVSHAIRMSYVCRIACCILSKDSHAVSRIACCIFSSKDCLLHVSCFSCSKVCLLFVGLSDVYIVRILMQ